MISNRSHDELKEWWRRRVLNGIKELDSFADQLRREDIFNHQKFRRLRARFGSQADWAALVGVSQATIGNYERNATYPNKQIRVAILGAVEKFREEEASKLNALRPGSYEVDSAAARTALDESILNAALTDFQFDFDEQKVIPVPFSDATFGNVEEISRERKNLLDSLALQASELAASLSNGANTNIRRMVEALENYHQQCSSEKPNARILYRSGTNVNRALANDEISWGIGEFDKVAIEGFLDDHNELMRLFYREALVKMQEVDAAHVAPHAELPNGADFSDVAALIEMANEEQGESLFDPAIPTLIRDIAREIEEAHENEILATDLERKRILRKRRVDAIKNGSILVGRFLIFTSFFVAFDPVVSLSVAGSIASVIGLVEQQSPGTVRAYYQRLRVAVPFLPKFPVKK